MSEVDYLCSSEFKIRIKSDGKKDKSKNYQTKGIGHYIDNNGNKIGDECLFKLYIGDHSRLNKLIETLINGESQNCFVEFPTIPIIIDGKKQEKNLPYIATYKKGKSFEDQLFMGVKYYSEGSLVDLVEKKKKEGKKFEVNDIFDFTKDVLSAIIFAHSKMIFLKAHSPDHIYYEKNDAGNINYRIGGLEYIETMTLKNPVYKSTFGEMFGCDKCYGNKCMSKDGYILGLDLIYIITGKIPTKEVIESESWKKMIDSDLVKQLINYLLNLKKDSFLKENKQELYDCLFMDKWEKRQIIYNDNASISSVCELPFFGQNIVAKIFTAKGSNYFEVEKKNWLNFMNLPFIVPLIYSTKSALISEKQKTDLSNYMQERSYFTFDEFVRMAWSLGQAIYSIHNQEYIHRDIKPANVFTCFDGDKVIYLRLSDFGISRKYKMDDQTIKSMTAKSGTFYYMAPEVYTSTHYNNKADIWSYGILLFEIAFKYIPDEVKKFFLAKSKTFDPSKFALNWDKYTREFYSMAHKKEETKEQCDLILEYIQSCLVADYKNRPSMSQLLKNPIFTKSTNYLIRVQNDLAPYEFDEANDDEDEVSKSSTNKFVNNSLIDLKDNNGYYTTIINTLDNEEVKKNYATLSTVEVFEKFNQGLCTWSKISLEESKKYNILPLRDSIFIPPTILFVITNRIQESLIGFDFNDEANYSMVFSFAKDILIAINYLHCLGIAHRWLDPKNIYILEKNDSHKKEYVAAVGGLIYSRITFDSLTKNSIIRGIDEKFDTRSKRECTSQKNIKKWDIWDYGKILFFMLMKGDIGKYNEVISNILKDEDVEYEEFWDKNVYNIAVKCLKLDINEIPSSKELLKELNNYG